MVSARKGVNPLSKEECILKRSSQTVLQQPVSTVGRAPETVVRASDGARDRVKSNMSEAWTGAALNRQLVSSSEWNTAQTS